MMTRHAWIGAAVLCLTLAACNGPAKPAASIPSADSFRAEPFEVRVGEAIERVNGALVTNAFFREAKVQPLLGRVFLDEEYQVAAVPVVVIAASLWQRQFGGDRAIIGKTLSVNQQRCTIVGILPKTFQFPTGAELWMPQNR
jgi:putative ABC transport system permease protein